MPEYILTAEHLKKVFRGREKYGKKGKDICAEAVKVRWPI